MTFELTYFWFNLLEGIFWILLSIGCLYTFFRFRHTAYEKLAVFTGVTLLLFGISDFVEIKVDGFIGHNEWLFVWKALCVSALVCSLFWYGYLRRKREVISK